MSAMTDKTQTQRNNIPEIVQHLKARSKRVGFEVKPENYPKMVNRLYAQFMKDGRIETFEEREAQVEEQRKYYDLTGDIR